MEALDRLDSWKRIAAYLKRDVTTVQRWERLEALPVHRHQHEKQGSVYAYRTELDLWWTQRRRALTTEEASSNGTSAKPAPFGHRVRRRLLGSMAALALLAGLALATGLGAWYVRASGYFWRNPLAEAKVSRLTDFRGTEQAATISRDGRFVALLADREGHMDAWSTEIGTNQFRNLTNGQVPELSNPSIRTLRFSPDASRVSIWTRSSNGTRPEDIKLMSAPTKGGSLQLYMPEVAELDWSPDGTQLVFHTTAPGDPLFVQTAGATAARQIYIAPPGTHCHYPTWSPDGQFIYFVRGEPPARWDLWRLRPSGAGLEQLTFRNTRISDPVLLDSRTLAYLAADADGAGLSLYIMDLPRRRAHLVSVGLERYTSLSASANGMRLVATVANSQSDLWRVKIGGSAAAQPPATPVVAVAHDAFSPRFGTDYVVYVSTAAGRSGIWKLTGETSTELWGETGSAQLGAPAIAPDGRHIAFTVERHEVTQLYVMDDDGRHSRVLAPALALRGNLAWAPDSQSLLSGMVRDGEPRLTRIFLDGRPPQPLVAEYSIDPVWSPDGKYFIYSGADVGTTFPLRASSPVGKPMGMPSLVLTRGARRVAFSRSTRSLVILRGEIDHKNFWLSDPQTGVERQLTNLPANFTIGDFDVSADGTQIVFARKQNSSAIALIQRAQ